jgi:hypothetical protein
MILDLPYIGNISTHPSVPFEGYKCAISKPWKEREFNL